MNDMMNQKATNVDASTSSARLRKQAQEAIEFWKENCDGHPEPQAILVEIDAYSSEGHGLAHSYDSREEFETDLISARRGEVISDEAKQGLAEAIAKMWKADPEGQVLYVAIERCTMGFPVGAISGFVTLDPEAPNRPRNCSATPGGWTRLGATP